MEKKKIETAKKEQKADKTAAEAKGNASKAKAVAMTAAKTKPSNLQELLKLRAEIKRRRPPFQRDQLYRHGLRNVKLADVWRRPKGRHSKIRQRIRGAIPTPGYGSPAAVRGFHPSGFCEKLVHNLQELEGIDAKKIAVRISASVGMRKKILVVKKAQQLGLKILNPAITEKIFAKAADEKETGKETEKKEKKESK